MTQQIIGRKEEKKLLNRCLSSKEAEFVAVYGRRRVGKTSLIKHVIESSGAASIEVTGLKDGNVEQQLSLFVRAFSKTFKPVYPISTPENWLKAFEMLTAAIDQSFSKKTFIIFLDELPWLATAKSGLLQMIDHFWNTEWVNSSNIKLIVCGSAASWILDNLINAKGGLHNRLTATLLLKPFTLQETSTFLESRNIQMSIHQTLDLYLAVGGIPFYLKSIEKGLSAVQNINQLCFTSSGFLYSEFDRLYSSLFKNTDAYLEIVQTISTQPQGIEQGVLEGRLKLSTSGGTLTKRLKELEAAGFLMSFIPYGREKKGIYYRIIDEYTLFYLRWIAPATNRIKLTTPQGNYWQSKCQTAAWKSWVGYAFEAFCYKHIEKITQALKIHTGFEIGTWRYIPKSKCEKGVQIDLLLDRDDAVINIVEIKYSQKPYRITKQYAEQLGAKIDVFREQLGIKKSIHLTMVTTEGLISNQYSDALVASELKLEDFF